MRILATFLSPAILLVSLFAPSSQAQTLFFQLPTLGCPGPTATADFNHDGKPDLVCSNGTILLGNGDGTFTPATPLAAGSGGSRDPLIADFNGDGKPDVLLGSSVYLGNGDGTFQSPLPINAGTSQSVVVADVNGDGKPDVLGLIPNGGVLVLLGKGDGTFTTTNVVYGSSGLTLAAADFNGDGKVDIILGTPSGTHFLLLLLGNGDGTFQTGIALDGGIGGSEIVAHDMNADGKLDLVVVGAQTYVLLGNGDGTFQAPSTPVPAAGALAIADVNADGKLDLIIFDIFAQVFLGNGDGTFTAKDAVFGQFGSAQVPMPSSGLIPVADFNGDGKPDFVAMNSLFLGNGDGIFRGSPAVSLNQDLGAFSAPIIAGDFNGDGSLDVAVFSNTNSINGALYILLNKGDGSFLVAHRYPVGLLPQVLATADLKHDGKVDILFGADAGSGETNLYVMQGNGDGSFGNPTVLVSQIPGPGVAIADFNGDHFPDLAVTSSSGLEIFLNKGDGTFGPPVINGSGAGQNILTADFNGDGIPDLGVTNNASLLVLLGNGDGTFKPPVSSSAVGTFVADLNGDGKADLISTTLDGGNYDLNVFLGNGDGTFTALPPVTGFPKFTFFPFAADINGDGKIDLIERSGLIVLLGNGDGTFGSPIVVVPGCPNCFAPIPLLIADLNGDHRPDALLSSSLPGSLDPAAVGVITFLNVAGPAVPDFAISNSELAPQTVAAGSAATTTVTLTPVSGFSGAVALSCVGLPAGATCSFAPASVPGGSGTSALTITTTAAAPAGTFFVSIVGTSAALTHERLDTLTITAAPDFSMSPGTATSATVTAGQTATYMLSFASSGGLNQSVALTCSGAPANSTCAISPNAVSLSGTTTPSATVTVTTTAASMNIPIPSGMGGRQKDYPRVFTPLLAIAFCIVWFMALFSWHRKSRPQWSLALSFTILLCVAVAMAGCGGGGSTTTPPPLSGGTPAGSYTITVTGTVRSGSTALTHTTKLTLVVQ